MKKKTANNWRLENPEISLAAVFFYYDNSRLGYLREKNIFGITLWHYFNLPPTLNV